jgi:hypothetical protein
MLLTAGLSIAAFGETRTIQKTFAEDPIDHPLSPLFMVTMFAVVVLMVLVVVGIYMIRVMMHFKREKPGSTSSPGLLTPNTVIRKKQIRLYSWLGVSVMIIIAVIIGAFQK